MESNLSTSAETAARHEIEETLHTVLYPGTEVMTDGLSRTLSSCYYREYWALID
jgi:hypothetical protein